MNSNEIDVPGLKHILWHKLRDDLQRYIPDVAQSKLLMCPACCRFLPIEDFSVEHVIPKQSLTDDPIGAKLALDQNQRTAVTLLCTKQLFIKGKKIYDNGCNSWKGRFYDRPLREIFNGKAAKGKNFTSRHHVALFSSCFLGLFGEFGFQIPLCESGLIMRRQFFNPNSFIKEVPIRHQMALLGKPPDTFAEYGLKYWSPCFKFDFEDASCLVVVRNARAFLVYSNAYPAFSM